MSVPGFTAEAAVYRSSRSYRRDPRGASAEGARLSPAERECPALDCTDLPNGEYPNPEDCGSFCYCVWGKSVWTDCPVPLHFNPDLKVCDWPDQAGCVLAHPPAPAATT